MSSFAAVIVLHESRNELAALLDSLQDPKPRLVVVDTGRDDGGAALARAHDAEVLERRDNPGFGAASNAGLQRVTEDVTILLNPDIVVHGSALADLAQRAREHPRALHAPRLLNSDGSVQRSAHPLPGTLGAFLPALVHPPLLPRPLRDRVEPFRSSRPRTVGWAIAACLAAATPTLKLLGPFDPSIHLFAEDMDLCLRARAQGLPTVLHPDLRLTHTGGHSVLREGEPFELLARRRAQVIQATRGRRARNLDDTAQALTFATRALVKRPNTRERAQLAALARWESRSAAQTPRNKRGPG
jgi:N-acetylglucosaminyl-diphospho-decaprenol L-rhamnosyltransferase